MARYLITGGAGFIGSHLCDALIKHHTVDVLDNLSSGLVKNLPQGVNFTEGDICDRALLENMMSKVDGCFHLAAIVSIPLCNQDFLVTEKINATGTLNVIESARLASKHKHPVPIVFASTCAVYGDRKPLPHDELAATDPISIYATLKLCSEYYGQFSNELHQSPFTALRLFNVYGSRQRLDNAYAGVISIFLNRLLQGQACQIYGDGTKSRDFVYVGDVVKFFLQAMKTSTNTMRTFNVCTGVATDVKTIAHILADLLKKDLHLEHLPERASDIAHSLGNPKFATETLGIIADTSVRSGLKRLVESICW